MAVQNPQALQELMQALSGGGGGMVAPPAPVQFQQASSPSQDIDRQRQEFIDILTSQEPTPLDVPDAPGKFQMVAAGISDAISKLAAGRAPRGLPISDNRGLLRQRRSEREAIIRKNTETQNEFQQRQARAKAEIGLRELDRKQGRLDREADIKGQREFEAGMAEAAATRSASLQEFLQNDEQAFRAEMRQMEIAARERLANIPDPATKAEVTRVRSALKLKVIEAKRALSSGSDSATFAELEAEFEDELAVNEALSDEDRADLRAFFVANISEPAEKREAEIRQQTGEPSSLFPVGFGVAGADIWQRLKDKFDTPTPRE